MIILSLMGLGLQKLRWSRRKDVAGSRSKASRRSHPFDWVYRIYQRGAEEANRVTGGSYTIGTW